MFSFLEASQKLKAPLELPVLDLYVHEASIDTRTLQTGDVFVALTGNYQDGHAFLKEAFRKGASGALIDRKYYSENPAAFKDPDILFRNLLLVENPQRSFCELAAWYRSLFPIPAIGITGSVGKTSTKEFLYFILSHFKPTLASLGNKNNHLGLPLTLFRLKEGHAYIAAELGANHVGEIRFLSEILKPVCGIITQIAPVHVEGFGSLEKIYDAKMELLESLPKGGLAVIPDDDPVLKERAKGLGIQVLSVGKNPEADRPISEIRVASAHVHFKYGKKDFAFPGIAPFLARNACLALAMAESFGLDVNTLPEVWKDFKLPEGRFEEKRLPDGIRIIFDGYNANPFSFEAALEAFEGVESTGRRVLVFSDMLELGLKEEEYHAKLGEKIAKSGLNGVYAYGPRSKTTIQVIKKQMPKMNYCHFAGPEELAYYLGSWLEFGDTILLKASRGMKIEQVMDKLTEILAQKSEVTN